MYQLASFDQTDGGCYGKAHQTQRSAVLSRPYLSDAVHSRPRRASSQAIAWCTGDVELTEKLGRNDLCPCGSGKRFKQCCLKSGKYDGSYRDYYFQGAPVKRRSDPSIPKIDQRALTGLIRKINARNWHFSDLRPSFLECLFASESAHSALDSCYRNRANVYPGGSKRIASSSSASPKAEFAAHPLQSALKTLFSPCVEPNGNRGSQPQRGTAIADCGQGPSSP